MALPTPANPSLGIRRDAGSQIRMALRLRIATRPDLWSLIPDRLPLGTPHAISAFSTLFSTALLSKPKKLI